MKWRPKGGKPLTVGCNARLDHGLVSEARRCGELLRPTAVEGFIELDEAAANEGTLELAALGLTKAKGQTHGPPRRPGCAAQHARAKREPMTG